MSDEKPTLEDVYNEVRAGEQRQTAQSGQQNQAGVTGNETTANNDPTVLLRNEIEAHRAEMAAERERLATEQEKADLQATLETVAAKVGDSPNRDLLKYALADRYNSDPHFKAIWDARKENPDALSKAVDVLVPELREKFAVATNEQVRADSEAFDSASQSGAAPPASEQQTHDLMGQTKSEFEQSWARLTRGSF